MNHLNKRRDELAQNYAAACYEVNSYQYDNANEDFQEGFDAALSELKPEIDRLVEALEIASTAHEYKTTNVCLEALQRWREFKGDE